MTEEPTRKSPRQRGRPCKEPSWLPEVAQKVAHGTPLRRALWSLGVYHLTERELKNIYRWKRFRELYETAKIAFYREWGRFPVELTPSLESDCSQHWKPAVRPRTTCGTVEVIQRARRLLSQPTADFGE